MPATAVMTMLPPYSEPPTLPGPDATFRRMAEERQRQLTKPPGSLGELETLAIRLAAQQATAAPAVDPVWITVFAADHGVCAEGVSAFPQDVTAQMIRNFSTGGAAICVLARLWQAPLEVVNLGTRDPLPPLAGVHDARIAAGTANLALAPAMRRDQLEQALDQGRAAAERAAAAGARLFIAGEMGIGNTTSAAATACALLDAPAEVMTGTGTGVNESTLLHKRAVVARALRRHGGNRDPLAVLASLGGFEIAAMAGAMLACAERRLPTLVDGFIAGTAALAAVSWQPALRDWLYVSHRSAETGHGLILDAMEATPLLDLGMRLGEGSGAATALPLLHAACALHNGMATFAEAGVARE